MKYQLRRLARAVILTVVLLGACGFCSSASACPNCKNANETDSNRPRAYMYSILFMIGMPATIFTGFGISFYRLTKKAELAAAQEAEDNSSDLDPASSENS